MLLPSGHGPRSTDLWADAVALLLPFGAATTQRCPDRDAWRRLPRKPPCDVRSLGWLQAAEGAPPVALAGCATGRLSAWSAQVSPDYSTP